MNEFLNLINNDKERNGNIETAIINEEVKSLQKDDLKPATKELLYKANNALEAFLNLTNTMQELDSTSDVLIALAKSTSVKKAGLNFDQLSDIITKK